MKSSLDHLPEKKQRELARVVEIIHEEFEDALKGGGGGLQEEGPHLEDYTLRLLRPRHLGR